MATNLSELIPNTLDSYWRELGHFVHDFAQMETLLQLFLMRETQVKFQVAQAIFSGVRIDTGKDFIRRTREAKGKAKNSVLDRAFAQMTVVTKARNDLLHYGANFTGTDGEGLVSNQILAMPGREYSFPVSPQILRHLSADVRTIQSGLLLVMTEEAPIPDDYRASLLASAQAAWRYIPPKPTHTRQQRQKAAKTQTAPPEASQD